MLRFSQNPPFKSVDSRFTKNICLERAQRAFKGACRKATFLVFNVKNEERAASVHYDGGAAQKRCRILVCLSFSHIANCNDNVANSPGNIREPEVTEAWGHVSASQVSPQQLHVTSAERNYFMLTSSGRDWRHPGISEPSIC